jgi:hypothetical protein
VGISLSNNINNGSSGSSGTNANASGLVGASGSGTPGYGGTTNKITAFGGVSGGFGLGANSAYGGAFNNPAIPDRVSSAAGSDINSVCLFL